MFLKGCSELRRHHSTWPRFKSGARLKRASLVQSRRLHQSWLPLFLRIGRRQPAGNLKTVFVNWSNDKPRLKNNLYVANFKSFFGSESRGVSFQLLKKFTRQKLISWSQIFVLQLLKGLIFDQNVLGWKWKQKITWTQSSWKWKGRKAEGSYGLRLEYFHCMAFDSTHDSTQVNQLRN